MKTIYCICIALLLAGASACDDVSGDTSANASAVIYKIDGDYVPSGYMGDINNIVVSPNTPDNSRPDSACIKVSYTPGGDKGFGGVYWQSPHDNWCGQPTTLPGKDMSGYKLLTFYCKGQTGREAVAFKIGEDCDSYQSADLNVRLTTSWRKLSIDCRGKNLSNIRGCFAFIIAAKANTDGATFYLDRIEFEK